MAYYLINGFWWLFSLLPLRLLYVLSDCIYYLLYYCIRYYEHPRQLTDYILKKYCEDNNLLISGGSDCHGERVLCLVL